MPHTLGTHTPGHSPLVLHPTPNPNPNQAYMHLTNFAINKHSEKFSIDDEGEGGHKRSVSSLMQCADRGG